jgi:hypothetical protein
LLNVFDGLVWFDDSGNSVALSSDGSTVAIGAPFNDGNGSSSGHTRVYQWNNTAWILLGNDIDGEAAVDWSGYSVSLSSDGSTVAIGAPRSNANGRDSGQTRVYQWNTTSRNQLGGDIDGEAAGDESGGRVDLSSDGMIVAIGAIGNGGNGFSFSGHTRVYQWDNTAWIQLGNDIDGKQDGDILGLSVALSGDRMILAVGANSERQRRALPLLDQL